MAERIVQSATKRIPLKAYLSTDHVTAATGKTIAIVISKNGAAFANPSGGATNATEISNGWYYFDASTTDTGTLGPLIVRGTASGVDDVEATFSVEVAIASSSEVAALRIKKNTALAAFEFQMFDSTTGDPDTGLTVTAERSIDGGAYAGCANAVAEVGSGTYKIDLAATDLNGNTITFKFTEAGAKNTYIEVISQP